MIVVDTNIIAYFFIPGDFTSKAEALLEKDPNWVAPTLWKSEFRNILSGYLRRQAFTFDQVISIQKKAENYFNGAEFEADSFDVLKLVSESDCSAYDCEFIAVAMKLGVNLVTMDKKLLRAFPECCLSLSAI